MAFVYEINGQRVEFEKEPTEADIDEAAKSLGQKPEKQIEDVAQQAAQALAPAAMYGATGLPELAKTALTAAEPMLGVGKGVIQGYKNNPVGAVADAVLLHGGMPPVFGGVKTAEGLYNTYKTAKEVGSNFNNMLSALPETARQDFYKVVDQLKPADKTRLMELAEKKGANALKSFQLPDYIGPKAAQTFGQLQSQVPSTMQKIGSVAGPIARGAGKVLGPAGMAMNVYDAQQMAEQTQLGQRLQQGQGQSAEAAFRNLNTKYGNAMTPVEAQNVLASGSQRDIAAFGGEDRLKQLIRQKAAQRVLGQ
jgi:hypothetical protein